MAATEDNAQTYAALTHEELVFRCIARDATIRSLRAELEEQRRKVRILERQVALGRNRI